MKPEAVSTSDLPDSIRLWTDRLRALASTPLVWLLAAAIALGGGGVAYGLPNLAVQVFALLLLAFHPRALGAFFSSAPRDLRWLAFASLLLPLAQLVPLPPALWHALPGRELEIEALKLVGAQDAWRPLTLAASRTLVGFVGLITPLAVLVLAFHASPQQLILACWAVVALGIVNFLLGVPQVISNGALAVPYPENPMPGVLFGSFANRNSTGIFLVCCLILLTVAPTRQRGVLAVLTQLTIGALLILAIILTRSRTAIALTLIPIGLAASGFARQALWPSVPVERHRHRKALILGIGAGLTALTLIMAALSQSDRIEASLTRFNQSEDRRVAIWEDSIYAAKRYWPAGAGIGTFDEVFQIDESLENLSQRKAGRAHNDYLEFAIEAGLPGIALVLAWALAIAIRSVQAFHRPGRWLAWGGSCVMAAIALQSITDYPLRNQAMLAIAALAVALLYRFGLNGKSAR